MDETSFVLIQPVSAASRDLRRAGMLFPLLCREAVSSLFLGCCSSVFLSLHGFFPIASIRESYASSESVLASLRCADFKIISEIAFLLFAL